MKKLLINYWPLLTLFLLSFVITWPLFQPGFFPHHDNIQPIRILEMRKCIEDFQIPCRWVPDMGYGYGYPLFNFYSVFPYYIGALLSYVLGFIGAAKALFFIPLVLGGLTMYLLGKEVYGKVAGFIAGVLYLFAPYRALDTYVRGAIAESFALALIPLVFYFTLRLIRKQSIGNFLGVSLSFGAFLTNHNIMTMYFTPVLGIWVLFWVLREQRSFSILKLLKNPGFRLTIFSLLLGMGLAAFFIIPAYIEKSLVQIDNLKESEFIPNFRAHFVTVRQLFFSRFWGYGASTWLEEDGISFQIGWPQWWLVAAAVFFALVKLVRPKLKLLQSISSAAILFFFIVFLGSIFMQHNKSAFLWERFEMLQFSQFPWRFLSLTIFSAALAGAGVVLLFKKRWQGAVAVAIVAVTVFFNWSFFQPARYDYNMTDTTVFTGDNWEFQRKAAIVDYLPLQAKEPKVGAPTKPQIATGSALVDTYTQGSDSFAFHVKVTDPAMVNIPIFDFPTWQIKANGKVVGHTVNKDVGTLEVTLPAGDYQVKGELHNTVTRTVANSISLLAVGLLILIYAKVIKIL